MFQSDIFAVILIVVSVFLLRSVWDVYKKSVVARISMDEARSDLEALQLKKTGLEREINSLSTERGIEEELRRRFQVVKPGEQVLVIVDKNDNKKAPLVRNDSWYEVVWKEILAAVSF